MPKIELYQNNIKRKGNRKVLEEITKDILKTNYNGNINCSDVTANFAKRSAGKNIDIFDLFLKSSDFYITYVVKIEKLNCGLYKNKYTAFRR